MAYQENYKINVKTNMKALDVLERRLGDIDKASTSLLSGKNQLKLNTTDFNKSVDSITTKIKTLKGEMVGLQTNYNPTSLTSLHSALKNSQTEVAQLEGKLSKLLNINSTKFKDVFTVPNNAVGALRTLHTLLEKFNQLTSNKDLFKSGKIEALSTRIQDTKNLMNSIKKSSSYTRQLKKEVGELQKAYQDLYKQTGYAGDIKNLIGKAEKELGKLPVTAEKAARKTIQELHKLSATKVDLSTLIKSKLATESILSSFKSEIKATSAEIVKLQKLSNSHKGTALEKTINTQIAQIKELESALSKGSIGVLQFNDKFAYMRGNSQHIKVLSNSLNTLNRGLLKSKESLNTLTDSSGFKSLDTNLKNVNKIVKDMEQAYTRVLNSKKDMDKSDTLNSATQGIASTSAHLSIFNKRREEVEKYLNFLNRVKIAENKITSLIDGAYSSMKGAPKHKENLGSLNLLAKYKAEVKNLMSAFNSNDLNNSLASSTKKLSHIESNVVGLTQSFKVLGSMSLNKLTSELNRVDLLVSKNSGNNALKEQQQQVHKLAKQYDNLYKALQSRSADASLSSNIKLINALEKQTVKLQNKLAQISGTASSVKFDTSGIDSSSRKLAILSQQLDTLYVKSARQTGLGNVFQDKTHLYTDNKAVIENNIKALQTLKKLLADSSSVEHFKKQLLTANLEVQKLGNSFTSMSKLEFQNKASGLDSITKKLDSMKIAIDTVVKAEKQMYDLQKQLNSSGAAPLSNRKGAQALIKNYEDLINKVNNRLKLNIDTKQAQKEILALSRSLSSLEDEGRKASAGLNKKGAFSWLINAGAKAAGWLGLYQAITAVQDAIVLTTEATIEADLNIRTMAAVLDVSTNSAASLHGELNELGTTIGGMPEDIDKAALAFARAGIGMSNTSEIVEATEVAIKMSKLTGDTLDSSSNAIISYFQVFKDNEETMTTIGDKLAYMANQSRLATSDINTFSNYALSAVKSIGGTVDVINGLAVSFSNAGVNASTIGTQIRKLQNILTGSSKSIKGFFQTIGINQGVLSNIFSSKDANGVSRDIEAITLLSTKLNSLSEIEFKRATQGMEVLTRDLLAKLRENASEFIKHANASRYDSNGELEKTAVITESIASSWERLLNILNKIPTAIATMNDGMLAKGFSGFVDIIGGTFEQEHKLSIDTADTHQKIAEVRDLIRDIKNSSIGSENDVQLGSLKDYLKTLTAVANKQSQLTKVTDSLDKVVANSPYSLAGDFLPSGNLASVLLGTVINQFADKNLLQPTAQSIKDITDKIKESGEFKQEDLQKIVEVIKEIKSLSTDIESNLQEDNISIGSENYREATNQIIRYQEQIKGLFKTVDLFYTINEGSVDSNITNEITSLIEGNITGVVGEKEFILPINLGVEATVSGVTFTNITALTDMVSDNFKTVKGAFESGSIDVASFIELLQTIKKDLNIPKLSEETFKVAESSIQTLGLADGTYEDSIKSIVSSYSPEKQEWNHANLLKAKYEIRTNKHNATSEDEIANWDSLLKIVNSVIDAYKLFSVTASELDKAELGIDKKLSDLHTNIESAEVKHLINMEAIRTKYKKAYAVAAQKSASTVTNLDYEQYLKKEKLLKSQIDSIREKRNILPIPEYSEDIPEDIDKIELDKNIKKYKELTNQLNSLELELAEIEGKKGKALQFDVPEALNKDIKTITDNVMAMFKAFEDNRFLSIAGIEKKYADIANKLKDPLYTKILIENKEDILSLLPKQIREKFSILLEEVQKQSKESPIVLEVELDSDNTKKKLDNFLTDSMPIDENSFLKKLAKLESNNNPKAKNKESSAEGLFQITDFWRRDKDIDQAFRKKRDTYLASQSLDINNMLGWSRQAQTDFMKKVMLPQYNIEMSRKQVPINEVTLALIHYLGLNDTQKVLADTTKFDDFRGRFPEANENNMSLHNYLKDFIDTDAINEVTTAFQDSNNNIIDAVIESLKQQSKDNFNKTKPIVDTFTSEIAEGKHIPEEALFQNISLKHFSDTDLSDSLSAQFDKIQLLEASLATLDAQKSEFLSKHNTLTDEEIKAVEAVVEGKKEIINLEKQQLENARLLADEATKSQLLLNKQVKKIEQTPAFTAQEQYDKNLLIEKVTKTSEIKDLELKLKYALPDNKADIQNQLKLSKQELDFIHNKEGHQVIFEEISSGLYTAMNDGFFSLVKGEFDSLGDWLKSFGKSILNSVVDPILKGFTGQLSSYITSSVFGNTSNTNGGGSNIISQLGTAIMGSESSSGGSSFLASILSPTSSEGVASTTIKSEQVNLAVKEDSVLDSVIDGVGYAKQGYDLVTGKTLSNFTEGVDTFKAWANTNIGTNFTIAGTANIASSSFATQAAQAAQLQQAANSGNLANTYFAQETQQILQNATAPAAPSVAAVGAASVAGGYVGSQIGSWAGGKLAPNSYANVGWGLAGGYAGGLAGASLMGASLSASWIPVVGWILAGIAVLSTMFGKKYKVQEGVGFEGMLEGFVDPSTLTDVTWHKQKKGSLGGNSVSTFTRKEMSYEETDSFNSLWNPFQSLSVKLNNKDMRILEDDKNLNYGEGITYAKLAETLPKRLIADWTGLEEKVWDKVVKTTDYSGDGVWGTETVTQEFDELIANPKVNEIYKLWKDYAKEVDKSVQEVILEAFSNLDTELKQLKAFELDFTKGIGGSAQFKIDTSMENLNLAGESAGIKNLAGMSITEFNEWYTAEAKKSPTPVRLGQMSSIKEAKTQQYADAATQYDTITEPIYSVLDEIEGMDDAVTPNILTWTEKLKNGTMSQVDIVNTLTSQFGISANAAIGFAQAMSNINWQVAYTAPTLTASDRSSIAKYSGASIYESVKEDSKLDLDNTTITDSLVSSGMYTQADIDAAKEGDGITVQSYLGKQGFDKSDKSARQDFGKNNVINMFKSSEYYKGEGYTYSDAELEVISLGLQSDFKYDYGMDVKSSPINVLIREEVSDSTDFKPKVNNSSSSNNQNSSSNNRASTTKDINWRDYINYTSDEEVKNAWVNYKALENDIATKNNLSEEQYNALNEQAQKFEQVIDQYISAAQQLVDVFKVPKSFTDSISILSNYSSSITSLEEDIERTEDGFVLINGQLVETTESLSDLTEASSNLKQILQNITDTQEAYKLDTFTSNDEKIAGLFGGLSLLNPTKETTVSEDYSLVGEDSSGIPVISKPLGNIDKKEIYIYSTDEQGEEVTTTIDSANYKDNKEIVFERNKPFAISDEKASPANLTDYSYYNVGGGMYNYVGDAKYSELIKQELIDMGISKEDLDRYDIDSYVKNKILGNASMGAVSSIKYQVQPITDYNEDGSFKLSIDDSYLKTQPYHSEIQRDDKDGYNLWLGSSGFNTDATTTQYDTEGMYLYRKEETGTDRLTDDELKRKFATPYSLDFSSDSIYANENIDSLQNVESTTLKTEDFGAGEEIINHMIINNPNYIYEQQASMQGLNYLGRDYATQGSIYDKFNLTNLGSANVIIEKITENIKPIDNKTFSDLYDKAITGDVEAMQELSEVFSIDEINELLGTDFTSVADLVNSTAQLDTAFINLQKQLLSFRDNVETAFAVFDDRQYLGNGLYIESKNDLSFNALENTEGINKTLKPILGDDFYTSSSSWKDTFSEIYASDGWYSKLSPTEQEKVKPLLDNVQSNVVGAKSSKADAISKYTGVGLVKSLMNEDEKSAYYTDYLANYGIDNTSRTGLFNSLETFNWDNITSSEEMSGLQEALEYNMSSMEQNTEALKQLSLDIRDYLHDLHFNALSPLKASEKKQIADENFDTIYADLLTSLGTDDVEKTQELWEQLKTVNNESLENSQELMGSAEYADFFNTRVGKIQAIESYIPELESPENTFSEAVDKFALIIEQFNNPTVEDTSVYHGDTVDSGFITTKIGQESIIKQSSTYTPVNYTDKERENLDKIEKSTAPDVSFKSSFLQFQDMTEINPDAYTQEDKQEWYNNIFKNWHTRYSEGKDTLYTNEQREFMRDQLGVTDFSWGSGVEENAYQEYKTTVAQEDAVERNSDAKNLEWRVFEKGMTALPDMTDAQKQQFAHYYVDNIDSLQGYIGSKSSSYATSFIEDSKNYGLTSYVVEILKNPSAYINSMESIESFKTTKNTLRSGRGTTAETESTVTVPLISSDDSSEMVESWKQATRESAKVTEKIYQDNNRGLINAVADVNTSIRQQTEILSTITASIYEELRRSGANLVNLFNANQSSVNTRTTKAPYSNSINKKVVGGVITRVAN